MSSTCVYVIGDDETLSLQIDTELAKLPKDVAEQVKRECLFYMPQFIDEENGCYIPNKWIKNKSLILLSQYMDEDTILHEIAHHYLGHEGPLDGKLSEEERKKGEDSVHKQVEIWNENSSAPF